MLICQHVAQEALQFTRVFVYFIVLYNFSSFCCVELNDKTRVNKWLAKVREKSVTSQSETSTRNLSGAIEGNHDIIQTA
jgi:hypothetical protein